MTPYDTMTIEDEIWMWAFTRIDKENMSDWELEGANSFVKRGCAVWVGNRLQKG